MSKFLSFLQVAQTWRLALGSAIFSDLGLVHLDVCIHNDWLVFTFISDQSPHYGAIWTVRQVQCIGLPLPTQYSPWEGGYNLSMIIKTGWRLRANSLKRLSQRFSNHGPRTTYGPWDLPLGSFTKKKKCVFSTARSSENFYTDRNRFGVIYLHICIYIISVILILWIIQSFIY